jgi:hypothetical protein
MPLPMHVNVADVQAWLEPVKASVPSLDPAMEQQISGQVIGQLLGGVFPDPLVLSWVDANTTPLLIRSVISMLYAAWYYDRQYGEVGASEGKAGFGTAYGALLRESATTLLTGIVSGSISLQETMPVGPTTSPLFYPTDVSSTDDARRSNSDPDDFSLGPVMFGVSKTF